MAPGSSFSLDAVQATFYPNAYPDCASGGAGGQKYGLPDLGSLAPDPTLPNRCQDPGALQACAAHALFQHSVWLCFRV